MRNWNPKDKSFHKYEVEDAERMGVKPWQIELLLLNPDYTSWGPHEDYMCGKESGWDSNQFFASWADFCGSFGKLDDLNELVNFYFAVERESEECKTCGGNGYHPKAQHVVNSFYSHMNPQGECWNDKITQDEVQALVDAGRLMDYTHEWTKGKGWVKKDPAVVPTAEEINSAQNMRGAGLRIHDAINQSILIDARLKRMGLPKTCPTCDGHGYVYTAPEPHVELVLWMIHPRKGAARGIEIKNIQQADLQDVFDFLRAARDRNHFRFSRIPTSAVIK
jgi:hypothetical protein